MMKTISNAYVIFVQEIVRRFRNLLFVIVCFLLLFLWTSRGFFFGKARARHYLSSTFRNLGMEWSRGIDLGDRLF